MKRLLMLAVVLLGCSQDPVSAGVGTVSAGIASGSEGTSCDDFCVDTFGAALLAQDEEAPFETSASVSCGEAVQFEGIPAGMRVRASVWAGVGDDHLLEGFSDPVTVVAGGVVQVPVILEPLSRPQVTSVTPEPIVVWPDGENVVLTGTGFGKGEGLFRVEMKDESLEVISWNDDRIEVRLGQASGGGVLRVRNCGVASPPVTVRVIGEKAGVSILNPLACEGMNLVSAVRLAGSADMVLALACADPSLGYLQRFRPFDCEMLGEPLALGGRPAALAAPLDETGVWVAMEGVSGLFHVPVPLPQDLPDAAATLPANSYARAIVAIGNAVYAIREDIEGSSELVVVDGQSTAAVELGTASMDLVAASATPTRVFVIARTLEGQGKLEVVDPGAPILEVLMGQCPDPLDLSVSRDDGWVAVACGGSKPGIWGYDLQQGTDTFVDISGAVAPLAIELDGTGDVAAVMDFQTGMAVLVHLPAGSSLITWDMGMWNTGGPLVRYPSNDRFLMNGPEAGELAVLSIFDSSLPCQDGGP